MINGSKSFDPDVDPSEDMGLTYEWYCLQKENGETINWKKENEIESIKYPPEPQVDKTDFPGCFGTGFGRLAGASIYDLHLQLSF